MKSEEIFPGDQDNAREMVLFLIESHFHQIFVVLVQIDEDKVAVQIIFIVFDNSIISFFAFVPENLISTIAEIGTNSI